MDPPGEGPLAESAARFLGTAQALTDELHDASALPGWTRRVPAGHPAAGVTRAANRIVRIAR